MGDHFVVVILDDFSRLGIIILLIAPKLTFYGERKQGVRCPLTVKHVGRAGGRSFIRAMLYFGDIAPFLQENDLSPAGRGKILGILADPQKKILLQVELAVVVDIGEHFVKATYSL